MDKILHDLKDSKLWELWHIPSYGSCRILSINRSVYFGPKRHPVFRHVEPWGKRWELAPHNFKLPVRWGGGVRNESEPWFRNIKCYMSRFQNPKP